MKDYYSKNDFWVRKNEDSDERKYYIRLNGMYIEVSKDVFDTCYYSYRKELRDKKRDQDLLSLNTLNANNHSLEDIIGVYDDTIQSINDNILITKIKSIRSKQIKILHICHYLLVNQMKKSLKRCIWNALQLIIINTESTKFYASN